MLSKLPNFSSAIVLLVILTTPVLADPIENEPSPSDPDNVPIAQPAEASPTVEEEAPVEEVASVEDDKPAHNAAIAEAYAPPTAADVANAPLPSRQSGVARHEPTGARPLLWVPRAIFFVPRLALEVVMATPRLTLYLNERYQVGARTREVFFSEGGDFGLYPTVGFFTGFGTTFGANSVHKDLFGLKVKAKASFGGRLSQSYFLKLSSDDMFDSVDIGISGGFTAAPREFFYGIGNGVAQDTPGLLIDPLIEGSDNVRSRFQSDEGLITGHADFKLPGNFGLNIASAFILRDFQSREDEGPADQRIENNFQIDKLTGFNSDLRTLYNEVELRYDTRRSLSPYESAATPGAGWLVDGYVGYAKGLTDGDPTDYFRYGADIQHSFRLAQGPRVLALRLLIEGVTGDYDEVPFTQLPRLGGATLLRGYDQDRFRDRALSLASAEYQWDLSGMLSGILFVDAGRVYRSFEDISFDDYRVGYGFAVQVHSMESFLMRMGVASSIDAGDANERTALFTFTFSPVYDPGARTERK